MDRHSFVGRRTISALTFVAALTAVVGTFLSWFKVVAIYDSVAFTHSEYKSFNLYQLRSLPLTRWSSIAPELIVAGALLLIVAGAAGLKGPWTSWQPIAVLLGAATVIFTSLMVLPSAIAYDDDGIIEGALNVHGHIAIVGRSSLGVQISTIGGLIGILALGIFVWGVARSGLKDIRRHHVLSTYKSSPLVR